MARKNGYNYFTFFEEMIDYGCKSAHQLQKITDHYEYEDLIIYREQMHELEHTADIKKHEMMENLMKEFLPPIDREDIVNIAHVLDEICDNIEEVILLLYMNDLKTCRADISELVKIVVKLCSELQELFSKFSKFKNDKSIEEHIIAVNTLEEVGDRLHLTAMKELVTDGTELRDIILWRDIYNCLENCCDTCEKAADAVEEVIMKNS